MDQTTRLTLPPHVHQALTALANAHSTPQILAQRARIILDLAQSQSISATAKRLAIGRKTVWNWRTRWLEHRQEWGQWPEPKLAKRIQEVLSDQPRPGHKPTFTAEQTAQVIALAGETPQASGLPISHWTLATLAAEAVRRGIVPAISCHTVWRFLKSGGPEAA